jgi:hypothetical protein
MKGSFPATAGRRAGTTNIESVYDRSPPYRFLYFSARHEIFIRFYPVARSSGEWPGYAGSKQQHKYGSLPGQTNSKMGRVHYSNSILHAQFVAIKIVIFVDGSISYTPTHAERFSPSRIIGPRRLATDKKTLTICVICVWSVREKVREMMWFGV